MFTALIDSRRLPGPNLYSSHAGAVLEVAVVPEHAASVMHTWKDVVRRLLDALGWCEEAIVVRAWPGGLGLFLTAPIDALLAATEVTEQALALAEGGPVTRQAFDDVVARLRVHVQHERHPRLATLWGEAHRRGRTFTFDDDSAAIGGGCGARCWPLANLPTLSDVPWDEVRDIPVALVTGSNGKTTTTRLLAAMLRAAGFVVGHTCTDGVYLDGALLEEGDWSGPAGARRVLRDSRVTAAVCETARGGILRRGIATATADVAVVTRIAADHFGEYGVHDEWSLAEAKLVVARALRTGAPVVLNADDNTLVALSRHVAAPMAWFSLDAANPVVRAHVLAGGTAAVLDQGRIVTIAHGTATDHAGVDEIPIALGGAARHNVANALAATAAAAALGLAKDAIRHALITFGGSATDNPGRLQVRHVHGATIIVDFVHNPDGWQAMLALAERLRAVGGRLIVTLGQAGDRNDADLDAMAQVVWGAHPDVIVLKEMEEYLRGRPYGQVTELLSAALRDAGAPEAVLRVAPDERSASRIALAEARPGDVVIIAAHADYDAVMTLVDASTSTS